MKATLKAGAMRAASVVRSRPKEVRWSAGGALVGVIVGLFIGGIGIAALGGGVGISASFVLAIVGAIIGNRIGIELDRRAASDLKKLDVSPSPLNLDR